MNIGLPPRLAAVWFGPKEVSTACALGVFGNQLGIAIGFLLPPMIVRNHEDPALIGYDLQKLFFASAGVNAIIFLLVLAGKNQFSTFHMRIFDLHLIV